MIAKTDQAFCSSRALILIVSHLGWHSATPPWRQRLGRSFAPDKTLIALGADPARPGQMAVVQG
ncbi:MAG: hypothetical protein U1A07_13270, partial [Phenylobacterium sp.]|nr:hypothetical protein [Phenylobacterium sp.]